MTRREKAEAQKTARGIMHVMGLVGQYRTTSSSSMLACFCIFLVLLSAAHLALKLIW